MLTESQKDRVRKMRVVADSTASRSSNGKSWWWRTTTISGLFGMIYLEPDRGFGDASEPIIGGCGA